jgi:hypothetical protein
MVAGITTMGLIALGCVLFAERGRLFKAKHLKPVAVAS